MNYEEKYKEALERAKELHDSYNLMHISVDEIEQIFPELAESEDERIRKQLIDAIKIGRSNSGISFTEEAASRYIAWLEKQKENPKSADSISSDCTADAKCEDRSPKHSDSDGTDIRDTPAYWRGWDDAMKQKEQKPEWSEEDRLHYANVLEALEYVKGCKSDYDKIEAVKSDIAWLKSLKPHWKPSEEQIDRLFSIVAALRKDYCDDMADFLANLYADLKKLGVKEEPEYYQHFDPDC